MRNLADLRRVHIVGVCGTLMGAFAAFLRRRGIAVTGSDQGIYPPMSDVLKNAGVELIEGYHADTLRKLPARPDIVVIGNVVRSDNPDARAAIDGGYAYTSLPEFMEKLLLQHTRNIVVSGTHGKTTTSSLLAHILIRGGKKPSFFLGGVPLDFPYSFHVENTDPGTPFILEGDEYDTAFWDKVPKFNHYLPDHAILTSIEYDHADIYPDFASVRRAFEGLLDRIRPGGILVACSDDATIRDLLPRAKSRVILYGEDAARGARFTPANVRMDGEQTVFDLLEDGNKIDTLRMFLPGRHNVWNAIAAWIVAREQGLSLDAIRAGMADFHGVKRRQEARGEKRGVLVIDDFAHHPTAVRETLKALKMKYPTRRIVAVFEPRSATSRRKVFQKEYADAFENADSIFIASPHDQSRIAAADQFSSEELVMDLHAAKRAAEVFRTVPEGVAQVAASARAGDLVAVLSNGGFGGFIPKLLEAL